MSSTTPLVAVPPQQEAVNSHPHEHSPEQAFDGVLAHLEERRARPLVTVDAVYPDRNWVEFTFYDRAGSGLEYEFHCCSARDAFEWIKQLAPKTWVTKEHIEVFAILVLQHFDPQGRVVPPCAG